MFPEECNMIHSIHTTFQQFHKCIPLVVARETLWLIELTTAFVYLYQSSGSSLFRAVASVCLASGHLSKLCLLFGPLRRNLLWCEAPCNGSRNYHCSPCLWHLFNFAQRVVQSIFFVHAHDATLESQKKLLCVILLIESECSTYASPNKAVTGSDNGLWPVICQATIWTNAGFFKCLFYAFACKSFCLNCWVFNSRTERSSSHKMCVRNRIARSTPERWILSIQHGISPGHAVVMQNRINLPRLVEHFVCQNLIQGWCHGLSSVFLDCYSHLQTCLNKGNSCCLLPLLHCGSIMSKTGITDQLFMSIWVPFY